MPYSTRRVVIVVKTYPELSSKHTETVCTVALDADTGTPIRLYPVPLRYLDSEAKYRLYDLIAVPVEKSASDPRPESFKIDARGIVPLDHIDSLHHWRERRSLVFRDPSWHFNSMDAILSANAGHHLSIAMIKPGTIVDVEVTEKAESEREVFERKSAELRTMKEADLFDPTYKDIGYLSSDIRLLWTCEEPCSTCTKQPHRMKVLDWGLLELARREGWDKAESRLREITHLNTHDFRLYLGNFRLHPRTFGIIGLWYPKIPVQQSLF